MSWQAYVDDSLVGSRTVDKGAIFNKEGSAVWATSKDFTVHPEELQAIVNHYNEKPAAGSPNTIFGTGFKINGEKYVTLRADERSLYGKKGKDGVLIVLTKQALLIAHYNQEQQPGAAAQTVEKLADYLISVGY